MARLKTKLIFIVLGLSTCFSSGCRFYYAPNVHNVPLFQKKKNFRASTALALTQNRVALEMQSAYSINEKYAAIANFQITRNESWIDRNWFIEGGGGWYKSLGKRFVFETYAGPGYFKGYNFYKKKELRDGSYQDASYSNTHFGRFFIQPSIGYVSNVLEVAFSCRNIYLRHLKSSINGNPGDSHNEDITSIKRHPNIFILEPAATIRIGGKNIKFQAQAGFSFASQNKI